MRAGLKPAQRPFLHVLCAVAARHFVFCSRDHCGRIGCRGRRLRARCPRAEAIRREEARSAPERPRPAADFVGTPALDRGSISIVMVTPCVVHHANARPPRLFQKLAALSLSCFNKPKLLKSLSYPRWTVVGSKRGKSRTVFGKRSAQMLALPLFNLTASDL